MGGVITPGGSKAAARRQQGGSKAAAKAAARRQQDTLFKRWKVYIRACAPNQASPLLPPAHAASAPKTLRLRVNTTSCAPRTVAVTVCELGKLGFQQKQQRRLLKNLPPSRSSITSLADACHLFSSTAPCCHTRSFARKSSARSSSCRQRRGSLRSNRQA